MRFSFFPPLFISLLSTAILLASAAVSYCEYGVTPLTDNDYFDWGPQINANGYAVWSGSDGTDDQNLPLRRRKHNPAYK